MKTESSNAQTSPAKLATTLLVTALCSQALPVGFFLLFAGGIGSAFGDSKGDIEVCLSPFFILSGPLLLGIYLKPGWRGIGIGLLGLLGEIGCFAFSFLVGQRIGPMPDTALSLLFIFPGLGGIITILLSTGEVKTIEDGMGIVLGIFIGISMSVGLDMIIIRIPGLSANYYNGGGVSFLPLLLPFPWIWLSAMFFPELLSRRTDRRGLLIYIAAMLIFTIVILIMSLGLLR